MELKPLPLKPCPFCGSDDVLFYGLVHDCMVICKNCTSQGPARADQEGAAEAWNRRADAPPKAQEPDNG